MKLPERPITLLIAALGGEGGGVMADWLMEAATACDYPAQATSILTAHFQGAVASGANARDSLRSTFVAACLSPSFIGIGM